MTKVANPKKSAFQAALSAFFILLLTILLALYGQHQKDFFSYLFTEKIFGVFVFLYLLAITFLGSLSLFFYSTFIWRQEIRPLEGKIHALARGQLDGKNFTYFSYDDVTFQGMEEDLFTVQKKLIQLNQELQEISSLPQYVDGQTKEDILKEERHRLARELHDSVSQQLFAATMLLSTLTELSEQQELSPVFAKQLKMVAEIIQAAQSEMRALLLHLRPVNLEGKSLKEGILQLLKELQTKVQLQIKWDIQETNVAKGIEDHLFRITQELLSNTLRHAKAKSLEVYLVEKNDVLLLRVVDDGVGFTQGQEKEKAGSYGLKNIRERVTSLGGTLKIVSLKNQGTSIEIKIPVVREEKDD